MVEKTAEELENELGTPAGDEEVAEVVELSDEDKEIEAQARRMGWRPREEFDRPPQRWVDAKTFVERGMSELPVLRDRYRKLDSNMQVQGAELADTKRTVVEQSIVLNEMREMMKHAEDRAYVRAAQELAARERAAVESADTAAYDSIQRERRDLDATRTPPAARTPAPAPAQAQPVATAPTANPAVEAWVAENPWFRSDPVLNSLAIAFDAQVKAEHPDWGVSDQLAEVKRLCATRFPEKFPTNHRRAAPVAVSTPSGGSSARPKQKGVKDLPKEFQDAFARFQRQMPGYTEAEYLKTLGEMQ